MAARNVCFTRVNRVRHITGGGAHTGVTIHTKKEKIHKESCIIYERWYSITNETQWTWLPHFKYTTTTLHFYAKCGMTLVKRLICSLSVYKICPFAQTKLITCSDLNEEALNKKIVAYKASLATRAFLDLSSWITRHNAHSRRHRNNFPLQIVYHLEKAAVCCPWNGYQKEMLALYRVSMLL